MRLATYEIFTFEELEADAKENARAWYRDGFDYDWCSESEKSIQYFCDAFGIKLINWSIDTYRGFDYQTSVNNDAFRGITYKDAEKMKLSDGYCIGELMETAFKGAFKDRGALDAFNYAINLGFQEWLADLRYQESNEYIDEALIANEYEFYADGERV